MDEADKAQDQIEGAEAEMLFQARKRAAAEAHPDFDGENCLDCDDPIPPARLKLGRIRCVPCQEQIERQQRLYAR